MQDCGNSIANTLRLVLSHPSIIMLNYAYVAVNYSSHDNLKAVYEAAHQIGDAMSDFVGHIGQPEGEWSSGSQPMREAVTCGVMCNVLHV